MEMGMNETPSGDRVRIGFFGRRNAGKSSLFNAVTGQELAVVSEKKGTTTDPVKKSMELLPLGPVVMIDTPGFDDEGELGEKRIEKTKDILAGIDVALLVVDAAVGLSACDRSLLTLFNAHNTPYLIAWNKADLVSGNVEISAEHVKQTIPVSAKTKEGIAELKERLAALGRKAENTRPLIEDLVEKGDILVLVIPIDFAAPKGRLILPQQQVIRAALDAGAQVVCTRESELSETLSSLKKAPKLVVTDSQAFEEVAGIVPESIPLTSFSILMARWKGTLAQQLSAVRAIDALRDGDTVLISEGCTHHRQCGDIGTVKLPAWLFSYTKKELKIETSSGTEFPKDLSRYALVIHCGGCMLTAKVMEERAKYAKTKQVPFTNYGMAIALMKGILSRSMEPLEKPE